MTKYSVLIHVAIVAIVGSFSNTVTDAANCVDQLPLCAGLTDGQCCTIPFYALACACRCGDVTCLKSAAPSTSQPTPAPTPQPSLSPTVSPTPTPSASPSTPQPTPAPTTPQPTLSPTVSPTPSPSERAALHYVAYEVGIATAGTIVRAYELLDLVTAISACDGKVDFTTNCPKIEELDLSLTNTLVSDASGFMALVAQNHQCALAQLNIKYCFRLSNANLSNIETGLTERGIWGYN